MATPTRPADTLLHTHRAFEQLNRYFLIRSGFELKYSACTYCNWYAIVTASGDRLLCKRGDPASVENSSSSSPSRENDALPSPQNGLVKGHVEGHQTVLSFFSNGLGVATRKSAWLQLNARQISRAIATPKATQRTAAAATITTTTNYFYVFFLCVFDLACVNAVNCFAIEVLRLLCRCTQHAVLMYRSECFVLCCSFFRRSPNGAPPPFDLPPV